MSKTCIIVLTVLTCLAKQAVFAQAPAHTDDEVKAQFVKAGMFCHADFIRGGCR